MQEVGEVNALNEGAGLDDLEQGQLHKHCCNFSIDACHTIIGKLARRHKSRLQFRLDRNLRCVRNSPVYLSVDEAAERRFIAPEPFPVPAHELAYATM